MTDHALAHPVAALVALAAAGALAGAALAALDCLIAPRGRT